MLTLKDFTEANRPQNVAVSLGQIRRAVAELPAEEGWQVIEDPTERLGLDKAGFAFAIIRFTGQEVERPAGRDFLGRRKTVLLPEWQGAVFDERTLNVVFAHSYSERAVKYSPARWLYPSFGWGENPIYRVLEILGISAVTVEAPERIVELPIPTWVGAESADYSQAWPNAPLVFESRARELRDEFVAELNALLGG